MPVLAVVFFLLSIAFFIIAILVTLPLIPGDSTRPWRGLPALLGFLFWVTAEFLVNGGMPK